MPLTPLDKNVFFSIVIPAYNEQGNIRNTLDAIITEFAEKEVNDYEILVVNDNSVDSTEEILKEYKNKYPFFRYINNVAPNGFGFAVRKGLYSFKGDSVCVVMADLSDSPSDIYTYYRELKAGYECVFGSRFMKGSKVIDYPKHKFILNRLVNYFIKFLFGMPHNDTTNAFKAYRRDVIEGILPIISCHFNLTVELPLKAFVRGYQFKKVPISWTNRVHGESNLKLEEMGSRYLFIILYIFLEKIMSKGDYLRKMKVNNTGQSDNDQAA